MKCYNCGAKLGRENICPECGVNVKIFKKIVMASNEYYNDALAKELARCMYSESAENRDSNFEMSAELKRELRDSSVPLPFTVIPILSSWLSYSAVRFFRLFWVFLTVRSSDAPDEFIILL